MRILVTGAAGFVGRSLVARLLTLDSLREASISISDRGLPQGSQDSRVCRIEGDLRAADVRQALLAVRPDVVFHLAGVLGGAAESDYALARAVNLDATLSLFEGLRDRDRPPRIVFASSIAVFGPLPPGVVVNDDTAPSPRLVYGAQKLMMEVALRNFSDRGELDSIALRLPGIVARRDADKRMKSSYIHQLFYAYESGINCTVPVSADGTSWLMSIRACVDALIHAAFLPTNWDCSRRAFTLPALCISMRNLVEGLAAAYPSSSAVVRFAPEQELEAQFARQPELRTDTADRLGFMHDGSIATLIGRAFAGNE